MIDRTTFDLRLAEHHATTTRINAGDWRRPGVARRRSALAAVAAALIALAARLDPTPRRTSRGDAPLAPATPS